MVRYTCLIIPARNLTAYDAHEDGTQTDLRLGRSGTCSGLQFKLTLGETVRRGVDLDKFPCSAARDHHVQR